MLIVFLANRSVKELMRRGPKAFGVVEKARLLCLELCSR